MNFTTFLIHASDRAWWHQKKVTAFTSDGQHPILFLSLLFDILHDQSADFLPIQRNRFTRNDTVTAVQAKLLQSFLGQKLLYWLGSITSFSNNDQKKLTTFLLDYTGPHSVVFFSNCDEQKLSNKKDRIIIRLPEKLNSSLFSHLICQLFQTLHPIRKKMLCTFFPQDASLTLDQCCLLIRYAELTSYKDKDQMQQELHTIFAPHASLTQLADSFFAKNESAFFAQWSRIATDYSDMFWLSFWSDLLWRSYHIVCLFKQGKSAQARQISFRVPALFITFYWRNYCLDELYNGYNFLYTIDYAIKNKSVFPALDLFYSRHFLGLFQEKK